MKQRLTIIFIVILIAGFGTVAGAGTDTSLIEREREQHSVAAVSPTAGSGEEIELDAIDIQGRVEKPSVIIMPKRIEPEMGNLEMERSFEKEVKAGIGETPNPETVLHQVDRVESIKKTVERKRN